MSSKPLKGKNQKEALSATRSGPNPAVFPLGSPQSRAAARAMLAQRKESRRSQCDEDALTIYRGLAYLTSPRTGWQVQPSSWDLHGNSIYERGQELSFQINPIIPAHLDEPFKRSTCDSREFEYAFGREPQAGDILRYKHVEWVHHKQLRELDCQEFSEAWQRRLSGLLCPKKFEDGHLFIHCRRRIDGQDEEAWVQDDSDTPRAVWSLILDVLRYDVGERLDVDAVRGLIFLGVGSRKQCGGFVEHQHRCRPATVEELQQIDPDPSGGILGLLRDAGCY